MTAQPLLLTDFLEDLDMYVDLVEERLRVSEPQRDAFEKVFLSGTVLLRSHFQIGALRADDLQAAARETRKRVEHLRALPSTKDEQRQFHYIASDLEFCAKRLEGRVANAALQGSTP